MTEDDTHDPYAEARAVIEAHATPDGGGCCRKCGRSMTDQLCDAPEVMDAVRVLQRRRNNHWVSTHGLNARGGVYPFTHA